MGRLQLRSGLAPALHVLSENYLSFCSCSVIALYSARLIMELVLLNEQAGNVGPPLDFGNYEFGEPS